RYRAVTPASVRSFVTAYLARHARVVVHVVPGRPDLGPDVPTPPAPSGSEGDAESVNTDEAWRSTPPTAGPERPLRLDKAQTSELSNGLTLVLSQRSGLPLVAANLVVRTGSDASPIDKPGLASFTAAMLDQGTATKNALQIADGVAEFGGRVTTATTMDASFIRGQALKKHFGRMLDLM